LRVRGRLLHDHRGEKLWMARASSASPAVPPVAESADDEDENTSPDRNTRFLLGMMEHLKR